MRVSIFIVALLTASLTLTACADNLSRRPVTQEGLEKATAEAKLLGLERQKFDEVHNLKGRIASEALQQMADEGYSCKLGYLDLPKLDHHSCTDTTCLLRAALIKGR